MSSITRDGKYQDRTKFLAALRAKLEGLRDGALRGTTLTWEEGPEVRATLAGYGARVVFAVAEGGWTCAAELPSFLPVPKGMLEEKFDREFEGLKGL